MLTVTQASPTEPSSDEADDGDNHHRKADQCDGDQQARAAETLDAARTHLAVVQGRLNRSWHLGGLTVAEKEEVTGLADVVVTAQEAWAAIDRQLQALVPPAPGQRGDAGDPALVRITGPAGANLRGRWWAAGSVVVADNLTATALLGGGIASPAA